MTTEAEEIHRRASTQLQRNMDEGKKKILMNMNLFVMDLFEMIIEGVANNMRNEFELDPNGEVRILLPIEPLPVNPVEEFIDAEEEEEGDDGEVDVDGGDVQVPLPLNKADAERKVETLQQEERPTIATYREIERSLPKYLKGRYFCPVAKCRKKFEKKTRWESHLRKHKARPFGCRYRGCEVVHYKHRSTAIRHIKQKHFKTLPRTLQEQRQKKIVDNRNPNHFVRIAFD